MTMTKLPSMGSKHKSKPTHPCICGCGLPTKGTWHTGHDGRATGWAIRIEKGLLTIEDVPEGERAGAAFRLQQRGVIAAPPMPLTKAERRAARKADKEAAIAAAAIATETVEPVESAA